MLLGDGRASSDRVLTRPTPRRGARRHGARPRIPGRRLWQLLSLAAALATLFVVPPGTEDRLLAVVGYLAAALWLQVGTRSTRSPDRGR